MSIGLPDNVAHTGHITGQSADSAQLSWDVVVIGAGIAGLAAACELGIRRPSARVLVLEASDRVGGKLKRAEVAGVPVDVGAEAMLARSAPGRALMEFAGLDADLISPSTLSATVFAAGATGTLPAGTLMGIPGDVAGVRNSTLLDADAIAAVANESQLPPLAPLSEDVAVGALVRERFGAQVLDRLVEPLLAGVYAGRADDISLQAAVPALYERLSRSGGSLLAASADAIAAGRATYTGDPKAPVFVSVSGGIATFAQALVAKADFSVRTGTTVQEIRRGTDGFELVCRSGTSTQMLDAAQVIVAAPAGKAAAMVRPVSATAAAEFAAIPSASMAIITLAYRIADVQAGGGVRAGSGVLVAPSEGRVVKAVTISSQKWPGYPADLLLLRASVGRVDEVAALQRDDEDLIRLVRSDLVALLGITAAPVDTLVTRWGGGLPQYQVGHRSRIARIRSALADVGGIAACGASFDGVGIPACITSAHAAVTALEQRRTLQV